jgi:hypothetical protein
VELLAGAPDEVEIVEAQPQQGPAYLHGDDAARNGKPRLGEGALEPRQAGIVRCQNQQPRQDGRRRCAVTQARLGNGSAHLAVKVMREAGTVDLRARRLGADAVHDLRVVEQIVGQTDIDRGLSQEVSGHFLGTPARESASNSLTGLLRTPFPESLGRAVPPRAGVALAPPR